MTQHVCEHLRALEDYLVSLKHAVTASGQVWSKNCRYWVYFDAVLDCEALKKKFKLTDCVEIHANDDARSGREKGLVCMTDHDAVMGIHPLDGKGAAPIA